jgi:hypothetical protein
MRLPRFRLRTLMVAVAVAAVVLGLGARSLAFRQRAECCRTRFEPVCGEYRPETPAEIAEDRRRTYHAHLWAKYERAARYPWLPVWPDPPEP